MHRPVVMGRRGMVSSAHYLASQAGLNVLRDGGNAMEAAITVNAVLNVVQPYACGMGGDVFYLIYLAGERKVLFLNGSGRSPFSSSIEFFLNKGMNKIPMRGIFSVTVPGCIHAWQEIYERFATKSLAYLLGPAVDYAQGFPASHHLVEIISKYRDVLQKEEQLQKIFLPKGKTPRPGDIISQEGLARTFMTLSERGLMDFYQGTIAEKIEKYMEKRGGLITAHDLAAHASTWDEPINTNYRGYTIYQTPPNTQGLAALLGFNLIEGWDMSKLGFQTAEYIHCLVEAKKIAYRDRDQYITDPDFVAPPLEQLLSKQYAAHQRSLIQRERVQEQYYEFDPAGDTTFFAVADEAGNMVSCIQSIYIPFGSGLMVEDTGIILHSRGAFFSLDPGHINRLEPHKRTFHTLTASLVTMGEKPYLVFGTMGGDGQPQTHLQVISAMIDYGLNIQEAIEAPRWVHGPVHPGENNTFLNMEGRFPAEVVTILESWGHSVRLIDEWAYEAGHAQGIMIDPATGVYMGGADPRGDGYVCAW